MKFCLLLMIVLLIPGVVGAELYEWTDNEGHVNYTSDPRNLPESVRKSIKIKDAAEQGTTPSATVRERDDDSKRFIRETIEKLVELTHQIDNGMRYVDEYHENERPVSKYVLISYINGMSQEIHNLREMQGNGSLTGEAKDSLKGRIREFEKKYNDCNVLINDFGSIQVSDLKTDIQIDFKTVTRTNSDPVNQTPYNQSTYTVAENYVFTFSAVVSNTGSMADLVIELKGMTDGGLPVTTHKIKTRIGSDSRKEIADRLVMARGAGQDITKWELSDVKITRNRK